MDWAALLARLNLRLLRNIFLAAAAVVLTMIPVDVLAVYSAGPPPRNASSKGDEGLFAGKVAAESTAIYRDALSASGLFGNVTVPAAHEALTRRAEITELTLKGIVILGGKDAIFEEKGTRRTFIVREGDAVRRFTVKEIREESVILADGNSESELRIEGGAA